MIRLLLGVYAMLLPVMISYFITKWGSKLPPTKDLRKSNMIFCLPCLSLIIYFVVIGIFFRTKRRFIKEATICFWKKITHQRCTDAFDDLMHKQFVMWLMNRSEVLARKFKDKRLFDVTLVVIATIFSLINTLILILLYRWLFIQSPCDAVEGVCRL